MRILILANNPIKNAGLEFLIKKPLINQLDTLDVRLCEIQRAGITALADAVNSNKLPNLGNLYIGRNEICLDLEGIMRNKGVILEE